VLEVEAVIERILVPTDGSPESDRALPFAERVAGAQGAEVLLAQVVQYPVLLDNYSIVSEDVYQQMLDATADAARENLARLASHFDGKGIPASATMLRGSPSACLLDFEAEHRVDLVVMSSHGRTGLNRFALGSTTDRLVREGTAPVLLVRAVGEASSLTTALLMLDGSGVAEEAVPVVEALVGRPLQAVKLFRAVDDPSDRSAATTYLSAVQRRLQAAGLKAEVLVEVGDPMVLLRRAAQGTDLIVLCTHGRGGLDRFRHGSVAERIVREAEQPVLLVRAGMSSSREEKRETANVEIVL
jgi:nucleotide-binding universal stress UspA family protein